MDLHYGLNWPILYDFSHNFSFIGRNSVWRGTLVNPVGFLEAVGTRLCGMPFSPPIWPTCHSTDIIGSVVVLEKWVARMRYQSTFSQEPPGPINASTVASMAVLGTTRDQILRGEIGCVSTVGLDCYSVSCHTCGGKSPGCSTVFLIQWTMSPSRPLIRSNENLRKISSGRKRCCHFIHAQKHGARWQGAKAKSDPFFQSHSPELAIVLRCPSTQSPLY